MRICLTGATGFIGRHVLSLLLAEGHDVLSIVRPGRESTLDVHARLQVVAQNLADVSAAELQGCSVLIHLAAHGVGQGMNDWAGCFRVNVHDSLKLWLTAHEAGVRRFVICGSCFEYGRSGERYDFIPVSAPLEPTGAYHSSKAAATMAALGFAVDKKVEVVVARPFHVFGEGEAPERFWPSLRRAALAGEDFPMSEGVQVRDFVAVEGVASQFRDLATTFAVETGKPKILNLGSGKPTTLRAFAEEWWARWGAKGRLLVGQVPMRPNEVLRYVPGL